MNDVVTHNHVVSLEHGVFIAEADLTAAIEPEVERFCGPGATAYEQTFVGSVEQAQKGAYTAFFAPAVRFVVKTSLDILNGEETAPRLPVEIVDRAAVAYKVCERVAEVAVEQEVFARGYTRPDTKRLTEQIESHVLLGDADYIRSLSSAVFSDAKSVAGGAFRLLQGNKPEADDPKAAIKRSLGLLYVSQLALELLPLAYEYLGDPYTFTDRLKTVKDNKGFKVRFTPDVMERLDEYHVSARGGCPMSKIRSDTSRGTLLQEDWRSLIDYLVPAGATVNKYRELNPEDQTMPLVQ
jgi:hypothetical protein